MDIWCDFDPCEWYMSVPASCRVSLLVGCHHRASRTDDFSFSSHPCLAVYRSKGKRSVGRLRKRWRRNRHIGLIRDWVMMMKFNGITSWGLRNVGKYCIRPKTLSSLFLPVTHVLKFSRVKISLFPTLFWTSREPHSSSRGKISQSNKEM